MFELPKEIELSGEKIPIKCDLLVLEKIQEKYGNITEFEKGLLIWEPDLDENGQEVKTEDGEKTLMHGINPEAGKVNDALYWMAQEGEEILAEKENRAARKLKRESLIRKVDIPPRQLAELLHMEFMRCFRSKKPQTTENTEAMSPETP